MTGPQRSYLHTLAQDAGRAVPDDLTKVEASRLIDELRQVTGRGLAFTARRRRYRRFQQRVEQRRLAG
jgi:hypothetical protein